MRKIRAEKTHVDEFYVDNIHVPLARYNHIADNISLLWGTQECLNYMSSLIQGTDRDPRPGEVGFEPGTKDALFALIKLHPKMEEMIRPKPDCYRWKTTKRGDL